MYAVVVCAFHASKGTHLEGVFGWKLRERVKQLTSFFFRARPLRIKLSSQSPERVHAFASANLAKRAKRLPMMILPDSHVEARRPEVVQCLARFRIYKVAGFVEFKTLHQQSSTRHKRPCE